MQDKALNPENILVINVSRIGDTLLATPAIRAIAQHWPQARITVLGHPKRVEVLENIPFMHAIGGMDNRRSILQGRLHGKRYDLAFVFGYDLPLLRYALRVADKVVAFRQSDENINRRLYQCVEPSATRSVHDTDLRFKLTDALGIERVDRHLSYVVSTSEKNWAINRLRQDIGGEPPHPLIGLQIASFPTKGYRDWPLENFSALCKRIVERWPSVHFLVFGGEQEQDRTQALHRLLLPQSTHYAGQLTLRQTGALMQQLDLYIGVDTGPTHVAGALDVPMVALYHPYLPSWRVAPPPRAGLSAIDHPQLSTDSGPEMSMSGISVDLVWDAVIKTMPASAGATT